VCPALGAMRVRMFMLPDSSAGESPHLTVRRNCHQDGGGSPPVINATQRSRGRSFAVPRFRIHR
jgi:hypothetical protein